MYNFFPYIEYDGMWTLRDSEMVELFEQFEKEQTINLIFRDNVIQTPEHFIRHFKYSGDKLYFWTVENKIGGIFWLNHFTGKRCNLHFNALKWTWGTHVTESGKNVLQRLLEVYDCILGDIPIDNKLAIRSVKTMGMKELCIVPKAIYDDGLNKSIDAMLLYITKEGSDAGN